MSGIRLSVRHPTDLVLEVHGKTGLEQIDKSPYSPG
jgi:hypothetical protein